MAPKAQHGAAAAADSGMHGCAVAYVWKREGWLAVQVRGVCYGCPGEGRFLRLWDARRSEKGIATLVQGTDVVFRVSNTCSMSSQCTVVFQVRLCSCGAPHVQHELSVHCGGRARGAAWRPLSPLCRCAQRHADRDPAWWAVPGMSATADLDGDRLSASGQKHSR